MNDIKRRVAIYLITLAVVTMVSSIAYWITRHDIFNTIAVMVSYLVLFVMLIDIGRSIEKKSTKKKYIIYCSTFIAQIALIRLISEVTSVEATDTWLGAIGATVIFLTLAILLRDVAKSIKSRHSLISGILYFLVVVIVVNAIMVSVIFLMGY